MLKFIFISKTNILFLTVLIFFMACDNQSYVKSYKVYKNISLKKSDQVNDSNEDFDWVTPESWIKFEGSSMRLASFEIPYSTGSGDLSIMELGGDGGGLEANVNRWRGQIGLDPLTKLEIKDEAGNGVSQIGNYLLFQLINLEKKESAFLAAVFPLESRTLFIKLTASADGILEIEKDFKDFCSSMKFEISKQ